MKKIIIVLMLVVMLALSACTADKTSEVTTPKKVSAQQWTYKLITQVCTYDTGSNDVICKDLATKDETMLSNIIGSQASDGYELDEVVLSPKGKTFAQTFIFRKAYVAPAEEAPAE
ncbi:MAG: hypothetical protein LLG42_03420 [Chloroflexi bacterium]|nr:hypothetical protein [Chloroflexota bacterium]